MYTGVRVCTHNYSDCTMCRRVYHDCREWTHVYSDFSLCTHVYRDCKFCSAQHIYALIYSRTKKSPLPLCHQILLPVVRIVFIRECFPPPPPFAGVITPQSAGGGGDGRPTPWCRSCSYSLDLPSFLVVLQQRLPLPPWWLPWTNISKLRVGD